MAFGADRGAAAGRDVDIPRVPTLNTVSFLRRCSRLEPFGNIQFQFGITLKYWMLPFGLMAVEMLQQQSIAAVLPHVVGVLCAHFHHFFAVVWPRIVLEERGGGVDPSAPKSKASPLAATRVGRKLGSG